MIGSSSQTGNPGNADRRIHRQGRCGWQSLGGRKRPRGCFPIGWKQSLVLGLDFGVRAPWTPVIPGLCAGFPSELRPFPRTSLPRLELRWISSLVRAWTSQNSQRITNRKPRLTLLVYKSINCFPAETPSKLLCYIKNYPGKQGTFWKKVFFFAKWVLICVRGSQ